LKKAVIIGSGFAGLSAACFLAQAGYAVTVLEKQSSPGGRARQLKEQGFAFDMGPSWYWMPEVFERFFNSFGKKVADYYQLERLDPSYRVYWPTGQMDIPADYEALKKVFENIEPGSAKQLDKFLKEAQYKYDVGINNLVHKPGRSITEFFDWEVIKGVFKLDVFTNMKKHVGKYFKNAQLQQLMEFPVLFLGALAKDTPALYSLMNYADIKLGTWYPKGGMYKIVEGMFSLAKELGVQFHFDCDVTKIEIDANVATNVTAQITMNYELSHKAPRATMNFPADVVVGAADYHFIETKLLPENSRNYTDAYWNKRVMAPSCLLYYVGLNKKISGITHHSLFFDTNFEVHGAAIYTQPQWPVDPLFYVCASSVTDRTQAPEGGENLFFLVPIAAGLQGDTEALREKYFENILNRWERRTGNRIKENIVYKKSYSVSNFVNDYNSFKGNAYGLANTLMQTAVLKPSCKSKKVENLFYTGQLTVPGPGVPPSLISGEVVAKEVIKQFGKLNSNLINLIHYSNKLGLRKEIRNDYDLQNRSLGGAGGGIDLFHITSQQCSKITTETYSTSFSSAIKLLHKELRTPIYNIYGFVRFADEIVDSFHGHDKKQLLQEFKTETCNAIERGISLNPVLHSFQLTVNEYKIETALIDAFFKSMACDLNNEKYDAEGYAAYIYGSAEVVGLMCLYVFCEGDKVTFEKLKPAAQALGAAFQKVNFLRDIKADYQQLNRTYFPGMDFKNFTACNETTDRG
jgi:phytoene desaturase